MRAIYEKEILDLTAQDSTDLLFNKKVKIFSKRKDLIENELIGTIIKIEFTNVSPIKPFEILLLNQDQEEYKISFISIERIEFI